MLYLFNIAVFLFLQKLCEKGKKSEIKKEKLDIQRKVKKREKIRLSYWVDQTLRQRSCLESLVLIWARLYPRARAGLAL